MSLLSKLLNFLKINISTREAHRFSIDSKNAPILIIDDFKFQIFDLSLNGISFLKDNQNLEILFNTIREARIEHNKSYLDIQIQVVRIDQSRISAKVTSELDEYSSFITKHFNYIIPNQI